MTEEKFAESEKSGGNSTNSGGYASSEDVDSLKNPSKLQSKIADGRKKPRSSHTTTVMGRLFRADSRDGDRFRWVFVLSVVAHIVVVLGVSFVLPSQAETSSIAPPLKITLVTEQSLTIPEKADNLAQFDSVGEDEDAGAPLLPTSGSPPKQTQAERERKLVEEQANATFNTDQPENQTQPDTPVASREDLRNAIDIAYLNAQAKPREKFVSANARASEVAPYLENWRLLVERVGNLNYPDAAKRDQIEGDLVMDVTVNADGSVAAVNILRSSGNKILDDGAERIVHLAAPFDSFSEEMKKEYDTLHIIRTWQFSQNTIRDVSR